jgi:hypothetical protein
MMIGTMLVERAAHLEPADVGQPQVDHHQIRRLLLEHRQPGAPVGGLQHLVALVLQRHAQRQADGVVVLDEQQ